ncbi:hypothetical protein CYMTET_14853 [Cymbomonas tetramitiformis]|uniref:Uncharacterized protein n=1 Tax=Cymbomonas tetramitiformis TaxID=36881 RepID=A0AAE0L9X4_9CHLO|nr:hypothetical protein CYMTET_14853 [Cymbomonas tetramitiformis]
MLRITSAGDKNSLRAKGGEQENVEGRTNESREVDPGSCSAIVPYTPSSLHGLHAPTVSYRFEALKTTIELDQTFGRKGVGTGGAAWPAGYVLAEYISRKTDSMNREGAQWTDARVCELGAGLGLVSAVSALMGAKVTATDGVDEVLDVMRSNINRNLPEPRHRVKVRRLQWGVQSKSEHDALKPPVDILLAADVVYGDGEVTGAWRDLLWSMEALSDERTLILLAHFSRYPQKEAPFWEMLDENFQRVAVDHRELMVGSERTQVFMLKKICKAESNGHHTPSIS